MTERERSLSEPEICSELLCLPAERINVSRKSRRRGILPVSANDACERSPTASNLGGGAEMACRRGEK